MFRRSRGAVLLLVLLVAALAMTAQAFLALPGGRPAQQQRQRLAPLQMGFFDAIKKGFENEEMSSPAPNAGLKNGPPTVSITFMPGNKKVTAVAGQNLKDVAAAARVPIRYNCKKGECGTCTVTLNGRKVKTCVGIVPRGERKNEITIVVPNK